MSADPTIFVNGKYIETLQTRDWKSYLEKNYPGAEYRWENGYQLFITPRKEKSK
jgi:hypothetical protein